MKFAEKLARSFWDKQIEVIRSKGILKPDKQVLAHVGLFKCTQLVILLGALSRLVQRQYLLLVTDRRVLLVHIPAFMFHSSGYHQHVAIPRPCQLQLPCPPKAEFHVGAKVTLPEQFAGLVGRPYAYVVFGQIAQATFDLAAAR